MSSQTIAGALAAIITTVRGVSGLRKVFDNPPEQVTQEPMVVVYVASGDVTGGPLQAKRAILSIAVDVIITGSRLDRDIATLAPFLDSIPPALWTDPSFGGAITNFENVQITFLSTDYGGKDVRGYQFLMQNVNLIN